LIRSKSGLYYFLFFLINKVINLYIPLKLEEFYSSGWRLLCNSSGGTHGVLGYGTGTFWPNVVPVYPYPLLIPVQTWVKSTESFASPSIFLCCRFLCLSFSAFLRRS
jgi:hypothetical protein